MNNQFDDLTKGLAQSVTRRAALKRFGVGLVGMALACFGLANKAQADKVTTTTCSNDADCSSGQVCCDGVCVDGIPSWCDTATDPCCCFCKGKGKKAVPATGLPVCNPSYVTCSVICGNLSLWGCGGGFSGPERFHLSIR